MLKTDGRKYDVRQNDGYIIYKKYKLKITFYFQGKLLMYFYRIHIIQIYIQKYIIYK